MRLSREDLNFKYSCWFHHMGKMRVVSKRKGKSDLILVAEQEPWTLGAKNFATITDAHALYVFTWLGRYLALKGKLPRHMALEQAAVGAQRTAKAIREVIANEHYQLNVLRNNEEQQ